MREGDKQGRGKGYFQACLRKLQKQHDQLQTMPQELLNDVPFDPENIEQMFYRELEELSNKEALLRKLGWKVIELQREQEDLTLFCLAVLSAECVLPLHFFTKRGSDGKLSIWLQVCIHVPSESLSFRRIYMQDIETKIFNYCQLRLLPLLRSFLKTNIVWEKIIQLDFNEESILAKLRTEIVQIANQEIGRKMRHPQV